MTDIISGDQPATPATMLEQLVGEGKKYDSNESLAASRLKADEHINTLETENKNMLEKLAILEDRNKEAATLTSVLEAINNKTPGQEANNHGASTPEDIREVVGSILSQTKATDLADTNRASVNEALITAFKGDAGKAKEFYNSKVASNRLTPESFKTLSETSPAAALNLLGINQLPSKGNLSPTTFADVNTDTGLDPLIRNDKYYAALRKEKGFNKYYANTNLVQEELAASAHPDFYTK